MVRVVVTSARGGSAAVKRPWLGAKLQLVTPEIAESLGLKRPAGALLASLMDGGPAAHAGIRTGDLIVSVDGIAVDDPDAFDYRFATKPLGGTAQIGVDARARHHGCGRAPGLADHSRDEIEIGSRSPFRGVTVANLSPALADELGIDQQVQGVVIVHVADGSPAQSVGFQKGDIVVSVNSRKRNGQPTSNGLRKPGAGCGASP